MRRIFSGYARVRKTHGCHERMLVSDVTCQQINLLSLIEKVTYISTYISRARMFVHDPVSRAKNRCVRVKQVLAEIAFLEKTRCLSEFDISILINTLTATRVYNEIPVRPRAPL
jgi:hypothetical protein